MKQAHQFTIERPGPFFLRLACACGEAWLVASEWYIPALKQAHLQRRKA
jgi:hypothetical protein